MSNQKSGGVILDGLRKSFGDFQAVRGASVSIPNGELVSFLGPSGCGKTTILRMIAGLEHPDEGTISLGGRGVNHIPTERRNIGMVFQNYALFPHMTVAANVGFGLKMQGCQVRDICKRVAESLDLVKMGSMADRFPSQLSGGQRQRVALARALVTHPTVLLLDEPLAALDRALREEMQLEIKSLQQRIGITTIFVTHDQEEALTLSDRIVVMNKGEIMQVGKPSDIYERPATRFVSDFVGLTNVFDATVESIASGIVSLKTALGPVSVRIGNKPVRQGQRLETIFRPEKVRLRFKSCEGSLAAEGIVSQIIYVGQNYRIHIDVCGQTVVASAPNISGDHPELRLGDSIKFGVAGSDIITFAIA